MPHLEIDIVKGKVADREGLAKVFRALKDGRWSLKFTQHRKETLRLTAIFHGIVVPAVFNRLVELNYQGIHDQKDAKMFMISKFLVRTAMNMNTGETESFVGHTDNLENDEWDMLIESCCSWAEAELGTLIPYRGTTSLNGHV